MKKSNQIAWVTILLMVTGMGCVKSIESHSTVATTTSADSKDTSSSRIVYTPFGPRHAYDVVHIEEGYQLRWDGGHLVKVDRSGKAVLDFGKQQPLSYLQLTGKGVRMIEGGRQGSSTLVPALGSGWITDGSCPQLPPVTYFSTTWTVPTAPPVIEGQTLYLFNGLEDGTSGTSHILQPVLQFGPGADGGGNNWYVDNWYASCQGCTAYFGTPVQVKSGTSITGVMQQTGQSGGSYSYSSSFTGAAYNAATLLVGNVSPLTYPFETMEAYGMQDVNGYPADNYVRMSNINIQASSPLYPALYWSDNNIVTDIGQHTVIVSYKNPGGDVDLYFHSAPGITGGGRFVYSSGTPSGSGTVTGPAGRYVSVSLSANGRPGGTFSLRMSLKGAPFASNGTGFLAAINGTVADGFYLPASGSVTWTANYSGSIQGFTGVLTIQ
jgi:hypothetical protein